MDSFRRRYLEVESLARQTAILFDEKQVRPFMVMYINNDDIIIVYPRSLKPASKTRTRLWVIPDLSLIRPFDNPVTGESEEVDTPFFLADTGQIVIYNPTVVYSGTPKSPHRQALYADWTLIDAADVIQSIPGMEGLDGLHHSLTNMSVSVAV